MEEPLYSNTAIAKPSNPVPNLKVDSLEFPMNEALTNLYVGLGRYARGERLSATRFVQGYAVDRILSVLHLLEQEVDYFPDPFGNERRLEEIPAFCWNHRRYDSGIRSCSRIGTSYFKFHRRGVSSQSKVKR